MNEMALTFEVGTLPTFNGIPLLGLPAEMSAQRQLSGSADGLVKKIADLRSQMIFGVIGKRTREGFDAAFDQIFPDYMKLAIASSAILAALVPASSIHRLASDSFCELEADIRDKALAAFGADMRDRAFFTVWTLRKISECLSAMLIGGINPGGGKEQQKQFEAFFLFHALRARFGIDCLTLSISSRTPIYPAVHPALANLLRSTVDAYAWIKQFAGSNPLPEESLSATPSWDDEDQRLLHESTYDMDHEAL